MIWSRFKRLAKGVLRPFVRPVLVRLDARTDARIEPLRHDIDALSRHLPILLDTISSQNAAAREARRDQVRMDADVQRLAAEIGGVRERGEFIRNELMYEMRYGASSPRGAAERTVEPRIVAPDRIPEAGEIRVNVGCGHIPLPDFVNVDSRELDHVDVIADARSLPFAPGTLSQVHSAHLLEHFPVEELRRSVLPYWFSLLRPGGRLTAVVPDAEAMISEFSAGRLSFDELRLVTFGQQEYDGDFHFNMFSRASVCELLSGAGLVDVRIVESARRNGLCYEMEVEGWRRAAESAAPSEMDASTAGRGR